jgi:hypothetical protein
MGTTSTSVRTADTTTSEEARSAWERRAGDFDVADTRDVRSADLGDVITRVRERDEERESALERELAMRGMFHKDCQKHMMGETDSSQDTKRKSYYHTLN